MDIRVFLVDDSSKTRRLLADVLAGQGFAFVGEAGTEAEANFWLEENSGSWDLAIIDLLLEQGAGLGVIARCRKTSREGKVVVFSAYASPGVRNRCVELGADAVFDKTDLAAMLEYCKRLSHGDPPQASP
ncbi:MAG TPA: response regulator [Ramlibacter sp.]|jgi:DNA-binding NarL/FixJ family response regulator|nr:response regulator [Ramlibacter sp.]